MLRGPRIPASHQFLHLLQLDWQRHFCGQIDAGLRQQTSHSLLGKVLDAHATVARPLIGRRILAIVHRHESQFVQPNW